ncbi:MAG TPA: hypothetical protein VLE22_19840 [Bryobacteraceae bacterium]|nr:hypothetical protein [Bryobacteraceae bacterium]
MRPHLLRFLLLAILAAPGYGSEGELWKTARANGTRVDDIFSRTRKMLHAWLSYADRETLLLPDRLPGLIRGKANVESAYTPHNSGADNYPYLILTAFFTDPQVYRGRMIDMLRNEIRFTNAAGSIPGNLDFKTRKLGPPSFFGAGEYAKDGLVSVTELLGRTPWFHRMVDMTADFAAHAPVETRFGNLPDDGAELNGDVLQTLARLIPMTADPRFLRWAEEIGDAYVQEILPANGYLPGYRWDFRKLSDAGHTRFRDHGNEVIVGLVLLHALETDMGRERGKTWLPVIRRMLDRVLESANPDGMLYNEVANRDLAPRNDRLSDNWGYVYAAVYAFYQVTGDTKYRDAVRRVLTNLPKYRNYDWESGSMDGYADSIESALYLVAREPVPEALDWIESEMKTLIAYQRPDGTIERWYGDGNWNRTLLLYAMMKTQGCYLKDWAPDVELGAVRDGERLLVSVHSPKPWSGRVAFDYARHRRVLNLTKNYARLNEWPEWHTVDENTLYTVRDAISGKEEIRLGSELIEGIDVAVPAGAAKKVIVSPVRRAR